MNEINYYELLGISKNATEVEIKNAYKIKARQFHPDFNGNSTFSNSMMVLLNQSFKTLSNKGQRQQYDLYILNSDYIRKKTSPVKLHKIIEVSDLLFLALAVLGILLIFQHKTNIDNLKNIAKNVNNPQNVERSYKQCLNQAFQDSADDQDIYSIMRENCIELNLAKLFYN